MTEHRMIYIYGSKRSGRTTALVNEIKKALCRGHKVAIASCDMKSIDFLKRSIDMSDISPEFIHLVDEIKKIKNESDIRGLNRPLFVDNFDYLDPGFREAIIDYSLFRPVVVTIRIEGELQPVLGENE